MNRKYEFDELLNEFNKEDGNIEDTVLKAEKRLKRRKYIFSPAISAATIFVCFVLLANFSAPAAYAFSKIPLIKGGICLFKNTSYKGFGKGCYVFTIS